MSTPRWCTATTSVGVSCGLLACLLSSSAAARTGTGDPAQVFRDRAPDQLVALHGQLRLRGAGMLDLDLARGASPTTGLPLFPSSAHGEDVRVRLSPSLFVGDELRAFLDVEASASYGLPPAGLPWAGTPQRPQDSEVSLALLDVRALGVEWLSPFGVLSIGRMPSHFGLGIGTNDGADLDDDGGDRADRIAFVAPLFGALVAAALDVGPLAPSAATALTAPRTPSTRALTIGEQAVSVGVMHWRAPWEVELYRDAGRLVLDGGAAVSYEWASKDLPGPSALLEAALAPSSAPVVRRDTRLLVADVWGRLVLGRLRLEGEAFVSDLFIDNPSPLAGVIVRRPITGNPAAGALVAAVDLLDDDLLATELELGAASADPAPGFPVASRDDPSTAFSGASAGDVFGPQLDFKRGGDNRFDAARMHPLHRVDLILWRTLLGGVSEAAYVRGELSSSPLPWLHLEGAAIYSHGLSAASTPGGTAPLGLELDGAVTVDGSLVGGAPSARSIDDVDDPYAAQHLWQALSLRIDAGVLLPLGGLGARGGTTPIPAEMAIVRLGYAL